MRMTIEQIIKYLPAPICGSTDIGKEKQKEYDAHDSAIIILRKYQKIEQIVNDELEYIHPLYRNPYKIALIKEVLEDEKT